MQWLRDSAGLFLLDVLCFCFFFLLYYVARGLVPTPVDVSTENALDIVHFEQALGIFWEESWQDAALGNDWLMNVANFTYKHAHLDFLVLFAFVLFLRDRHTYRLARNALIISLAIAVPFYLLTPTTPPRLLADAGYDYGFVDTVYGASRVGFFLNDYAAIPSFHYGWNAFYVFLVFRCWSSWLVRLPMLAFSALMFWSIVVTGNHYFFDLALGMLVMVGAWQLSLQLERWMERHTEWRERLTFRVRGHRLPF